MRNAMLRYALVLYGLFLAGQCALGQESGGGSEDQVVLRLRELRRQIKFSADVRDYEGVKELHQQLIDGFDSTKYLTLTGEEALMINYMISDYKGILRKVMEKPRPFGDTNYNAADPPEDGLFDHLLDVAVLDSSQLISKIVSSDLEDYEQAFVKLYLMTLLSLNSSSDISDKDLTHQGQLYLDEFAPTPFDSFVKVKVRRKFVKNEWGATAGIGAARGTFQGEFGNLLRFNLALLIDLEVNYKNMVAGLRLAGGEGTIRRDFEYEGFWERGLKVSPFYGGLYLGYKLDISPFRIIPFYDIGGTMITVAERDLTQDNEGFGIGGFTHGPGVSLDFIPPISWAGFNGETYRAGLRFKGGMLINTLKNKNPSFESNYPYLGIELIVDFVGSQLDLK